MPPPTNNLAPTTNLNQAYAQLGALYDPRVAQLQRQMQQSTNAELDKENNLAIDRNTALTSLNQAKANAFSNNSLTSNSRGLFFSGYAPQMNQAYLTNTYNPNVQKANTTYDRNLSAYKADYNATTQSLIDKINEINQKRANDANTLVMQTRAAASGGGGGGGGGGRGSSGGGGKPSQQQVATAISSALAKVTGRDGYVSPNDYAAAYLDWINSGGSTSSFNSNFGRFKNPGNKYYNYAITQAMKRG